MPAVAREEGVRVEAGDEELAPVAVIVRLAGQRARHLFGERLAAARAMALVAGLGPQQLDHVGAEVRQQLFSVDLV